VSIEPIASGATTKAFGRISMPQREAMREHLVMVMPTTARRRNSLSRPVEYLEWCKRKYDFPSVVRLG
jgi:hypothetical protein